jgi:hypothetical protein
LVVAGVVAAGGTGAVVADLPARIQHGASPTELASAHRAPGHAVAFGDVGLADAEPRRVTGDLGPAASEPSPTASVPRGGPAAGPGSGPDDPVDSGEHGRGADRKPDEAISEEASIRPVEDEPGPAPSPADVSSPPGLATKEGSPPGALEEDPPAGQAPSGSAEPSTKASPPPETPDRPKPSGQSRHGDDQSDVDDNRSDGEEGDGNESLVSTAAKGGNANAKGGNGEGGGTKAEGGEDGNGKSNAQGTGGSNPKAQSEGKQTGVGDGDGGNAGGSADRNGAPADSGGRTNGAPADGGRNPARGTHGKATGEGGGNSGGGNSGGGGGTATRGGKH